MSRFERIIWSGVVRVVLLIRKQRRIVVIAAFHVNNARVSWFNFIERCYF